MFLCNLEPLVPAWYELGIKDQGRTLLLSVARGAFSDLCRRLVASAPLIQTILKEFNFSVFIPPTEESWGFGKVLRLQPVQYPNWVTWQCILPQVTKRGVDSVNWPAIYTVSASLAVVFSALYITDDKGTYAKAQLLECELGLGQEMGSWGLHAGISPSLCQWLAKQPNSTHHQGITTAMQTAYQHIYGEATLDKYTQRSIWALTRQPKWINFHTEGDACGLDPHSGLADPDIKRGYELLDHNVDSPLQQLVLLVGLAALCQQARQDGF